MTCLLMVLLLGLKLNFQLWLQSRLLECGGEELLLVRRVHMLRRLQDLGCNGGLLGGWQWRLDLYLLLLQLQLLL